MASLPALKNFPLKTLNFLKKLSKNNSREWFEAHRDDYNSDFLEPALQLVVELGEKLLTITPNIQAIPKIDKSIFRLHRDVRFSKDKSPYKTNLGLYFWEGKKKMDSPGFYFEVNTKGSFYGSEIYMPSKEQWKLYRDAVSDPRLGKELNNAVKKILKKGSYELGGKKYKKVPKGYDPDLPYAEYLLYEGLYTFYDSENINELTKVDVVEFSFKKFKDMLPIHQWLVKVLG